MHLFPSRSYAIRPYLAYILLCSLWAGDTFGLMLSNNQRLDHALYPKHDQKLIVAGRIREIVIAESRPAVNGIVRYERSDTKMMFEVQSVILSNPSLKDTIIKVDAGLFQWPKQFALFQSGSFCILVLGDDNRDNSDHYLFTVVAARSHKYPHVENGESAKRVLAEELLAQIKEESSKQRRREMILQVSPILTSNEAKALVPFLDNPDPWLRRAALAGVLYATGETKYLDMAERDIRDFILTTKPMDLVDGDEKGIRSNAYALLVSHYFFLQANWDPEEDLRNKTVLRLYRLIAKEMTQSEWYRWDQGIRPLCRSGTLEDVNLLYEYLNSQRTGEIKMILDRPHCREEIRMGISRILGLNLTRWQTESAPSHEDEQLQTIRNALATRPTSQPSKNR